MRGGTRTWVGLLLAVLALGAQQSPVRADATHYQTLQLGERSRGMAAAFTAFATDGAAIHLHKTGVPTVVIGVPVRHIHSHSGILRRDDYDAALKLLVAVLRK